MEKNSSQLPHDSALKHVTGEAVYIEDIDVGNQLLQGHVVFSPHARAKIKSIHTEKAKAVPGVISVLTYKDIPGDNQMGPVMHDEPCLAENEVVCAGQAVALIAAETLEAAREAEKLIEIIYEPLEAILDIHTALEKNNLIAPARIIQRGNAEEALKKSPHLISGEIHTGAQEHWYLETQACLCVPGEGKEYFLQASTQHPSETQVIVAEVLGLPRNEVVVEVRRLGGAFGGKETQGNHLAAWSALLAYHTRRPVRIRLTRDEDQKITGKRHPFFSTYTIGFDNAGKILAYKVELNANAGHCCDLSMAILERAMFHAENSYFIPDVHITGRALRTNLPSNGAFRGFGGPQGMVVIENAIDRIAGFLKKDATEIRKINFYTEKNNITPYGQSIENIRLQALYEDILSSSEYEKRRKEIDAFNQKNEFVKRGIALTPVKFGISFTTAFLNQAGALVHIYADGTVQVNHGGIEMGQGLNSKMHHIAAAEFGIDSKHIKVTPTNTSKIPNTSATAASSGSDMNGMAVKDAVDKLKQRLANFFTELQGGKTKEENVRFENDFVFDSLNPTLKISFADLVNKAWMGRVSLSATGFYKTPDVYFDRENGVGKPFHYFAYGMAVSEAEVDVLTGQSKILRADILHDVGDSLHESIDLGQVQGAFIQGLGWCTTEEIKWDAEGHIMNYSPDTYKIPTVRDIPIDFRVRLMKDVPNANTIRRSKAVGEPPFMLAFSAWLAIKDAIAAVKGTSDFDFNIPATGEIVLGKLIL
jgi:xanthine dehydrogenase molybdopterin binding subunit